MDQHRHLMKETESASKCQQGSRRNVDRIVDSSECSFKMHFKLINMLYIDFFRSSCCRRHFVEQQRRGAKSVGER
jgi:hypothetical protein